MATIVDVAKEAKVSISTVSRVLNDSYLVTEETKQHVMAAVKKVGYIIPPRMKIHEKMVSRKSIILVITSVLIDDMISAIKEAAVEYDYLLICQNYESAEDYEQLEGLLKVIGDHIAGIILINAIDSSEKFQNLLQNYLVVQIGEPIMDHTENYVVYNDEIKMTYDATNYLIQQGCKRIAILTCAPSTVKLFSKSKRKQGYILALFDHGIPIDEKLCRYTDITIEGGYEATIRLVEEIPDVDAIVCICDVMAIGCVCALRDINTDILPISLDSNDLWNVSKKFIPYINPHIENMGSAAMRLLNSVICGDVGNGYHVVIEHELITDAAMCRKADIK